jgi:hypothetical protein
MTDNQPENRPTESPADTTCNEASRSPEAAESGDRPREIGGRKGPDPTRFGDWEKNGRCIDF